MWLSQQAADLHLEPGEYLIHEGEPTPFFVGERTESGSPADTQPPATFYPISSERHLPSPPLSALSATNPRMREYCAQITSAMPTYGLLSSSKMRFAGWGLRNPGIVSQSSIGSNRA